MNKLWVVFFFLAQVGSVVAQNKTGFFGKVVDSKTQNPLSFVVVSVQNSSLMQLTNEDGSFSFENVPAGNILVLMRNQGFQDNCIPWQSPLGTCWI